eukprot:scaffold141263_cov36-Prasinocladus_malaysianus.AAC.1
MEFSCASTQPLRLRQEICYKVFILHACMRMWIPDVTRFAFRIRPGHSIDDEPTHLGLGHSSVSAQGSYKGGHGAPKNKGRGTIEVPNLPVQCGLRDTQALPCTPPGNGAA